MSEILSKKNIFLIVGILLGAIPPALATSMLFSDVSEEDWYHDAVANLQEKGIVEGYPDETYRAADPLNRAEFAAMLDRLIAYVEEDTSLSEVVTLTEEPEEEELEEPEEMEEPTTPEDQNEASPASSGSTSSSSSAGSSSSSSTTNDSSQTTQASTSTGTESSSSSSSTTSSTSSSTASSSTSTSLPTAQTVILNVDFEKQEEGTYTDDDLDEDWFSSLWDNGLAKNEGESGNATITTEGSHGKVLAILFPQGKYGSQESGVSWEVALSESYGEMCIAYDLKVESGFDCVKGGKIPGIGGGTTPTGGDKPDGTDGFTVRGMFREACALESYAYHKDQPDNYGEDFYWSKDGSSVTLDDQWHTLTTCVEMNDPSANDGTLRAWFDANLVLDEIGFQWRTVSTFAIDSIVAHFFFGGSDSSWAPSKNQTMTVDNFKVFVPN